jgi:D-apionolactonase
MTLPPSGADGMGRAIAGQTPETGRRMSHEILHLRAGPFHVDCEAGELRRIRLRGVEVVNRIYPALRDGLWNTIPATIHDLTVERADDAFRVAYVAEHAQGGVRFRNQVEMLGHADGRMAMRMRGTALSAFARNRIGLCVLHPRSCAGGWVRVGHPDGSSEERSFPQAISPHQPFFDVASLTTRPVPGAEVAVRFAGEVFETEDQRNWGDASFKTYSTPSALPRPVDVPAGAVVEQAVEIALAGRPGPLIAADVACRPHPDAVVAGLRRCRLDRLRCELPAAGDWRPRLAAARDLAAQLELPLDLVLLGDPEGFADALAGAASAVALPTDRSTTPPAWVVRLRALLPGCPVGGGSGSQFTELNRDRPQAGGWPVLAFPVSPYVHATDAASLLENAPALVDIAAAARGIMPGAAIHVALAHARHAAVPGLAERHDGPVAADWLQRVLAAADGIAVLACGPTSGALGLVRDDGMPTPAGMVLALR